MMKVRSIKYNALFSLLTLLVGGCIKTGPPPAQVLEEVRQEVKQEAIQEVSQEEKASPQDILEETKLDQVLHQFQKAILLLENGKTEEARRLFETLRDRHPDVSVFHNNLGIAYKHLGLKEEAVQAYRQAIALHGGYPEAHYNLAIVLRGQGAFREAESAYTKAIDLSPDFQDAHYNLAVLYDLYLNDPDKALVHYQHYMERVDGAHEEIKIWIAALEKRLAASRSQP